MRTALVVFGVVVGIGQAAYGQPCPDGEWCEFNGHWYRLTSARPNWSQAEAEAVAAGGHLVTINNEAENTWLTATFPRPTAGDPNYWIGFYQDCGDPECTDVPCEPAGCWKWVSGEPVTYTNWHAGEPNNGSGGPVEHIAVLHWSGGADQGLWNDGADGGPGSGIIERDTPVPTLSEWGVVAMTLLLMTAGTIVFARRRESSLG